MEVEIRSAKELQLYFPNEAELSHRAGLTHCNQAHFSQHWGYGEPCEEQGNYQLPQLRRALPLHFAQLSAYIKEENEENPTFSEASVAQKKTCSTYVSISFQHATPPPKKERVEERGGSKDEIVILVKHVFARMSQT